MLQHFTELITVILAELGEVLNIVGVKLPLNLLLFMECYEFINRNMVLFKGILQLVASIVVYGTRSFWYLFCCKIESVEVVVAIRDKIFICFSDNAHCFVLSKVVSVYSYIRHL